MLQLNGYGKLKSTLLTSAIFVGCLVNQKGKHFLLDDKFHNFSALLLQQKVLTGFRKE